MFTMLVCSKLKGSCIALRQWCGLQTEVADKESRLGAAYESSARLEGLSQQREANLTGGLPVQISEGVLQDGPFSDDQIVDMVCLST